MEKSTLRVNRGYVAILETYAKNPSCILLISKVEIIVVDTVAYNSAKVSWVLSEAVVPSFIDFLRNELSSVRTR